MAKDVLSTEELSSLLTAVDETGQGPDAGPPGADADAQAHDFRRPSPVSRAQFGVLQRIHDSVAVAFSRTLSGCFRLPVEVSLVAIDVATYGGFNAALPNPICVQLFSAGPERDRCILTLDLSIAVGMLERLLGGSTGGQPLDQSRSLTTVEQAIVRGPLGTLLDALKAEWSVDKPIDLEHGELAMDPRAVQILGVQEVVVQVVFAVGGDVGVGDVNLCLPLRIVEALAPRDNSEPVPAADQAAALQHTIAAVPVRLTVELGRAIISVADLLSLQPGHVIRLDRSVHHPLDVTVEGKTYLAGRPGLVRNRIGLRVTRAPQPRKKGT